MQIIKVVVWFIHMIVQPRMKTVGQGSDNVFWWYCAPYQDRKPSEYLKNMFSEHWPTPISWLQSILFQFMETYINMYNECYLSFTSMSSVMKYRVAQQDFIPDKEQLCMLVSIHTWYFICFSAYEILQYPVYRPVGPICMSYHVSFWRALLIS